MEVQKSLERIKQTTLVKEILNRIKQMLLNKELNPGDRLPSEQTLADQFGVGKSSIREAIKMLDAVGVVESRQGSGTMICKYPKEDSLNPLIFQMILLQGSEKQLLEFRRMYETSYTFLAMEVMTAEDSNNIKSKLSSGSSAREDADFHRAVLAATHNPYIIRTGEVLIDLCEITLTRKPEITGSGIGINPGHQKIYDALIQKDHNQLKIALDESFEFYEKHFISEDQ